MKRIVGLILLGTVAFAAPQTLPSTQWELVNVKQGGVSTLAPGGTARPTLNFERDSGIVSGFGGCNDFRGAYTVEGKRIRVQNILATKKACAVLEVENGFFGVLGHASRVVVMPNTLLVSSDAGDSLLFTRMRTK